MGFRPRFTQLFTVLACVIAHRLYTLKAYFYRYVRRDTEQHEYWARLAYMQEREEDVTRDDATQQTLKSYNSRRKLKESVLKSVCSLRP